MESAASAVLHGELESDELVENIDIIFCALLIVSCTVIALRGISSNRHS